VVADLIQEGSKLVSRLMQVYATRRVTMEPVAIETKKDEAVERTTPRVSTEQTVLYQRKEIAKELILLEGHLQQGCKIGGQACDCCEKHPLKIEGLAQETLGMSPDPIYRELADWTHQIAPMTSENAAASGQYDTEYPGLAMKAREFRKAIMPAQIKEVAHEEAVSPGEQEP